MKKSVVVSTQITRFTDVAFQGNWAQSIERIAEMGYEGVELAIRDPGLLDEEAVRRTVAAHRLQVPAIGTGQAYLEEGLSLTDPDPAIRQRAIQRLKAHIDFAEPYGAIVIIGLVRGRLKKGDSRQQALAWLREGVQACADYARAKGIRLAIEPINRYEDDLLLRAEETLAFCRELGAENVGLLLDTFHMNIEERSLTEALARTGDRLFHVHVADSNRWYPGAGHIDFPAVLRTLREMGYQGFISGEMLPLPDPLTAAREMMRYLTSIGA